MLKGSLATACTISNKNSHIISHSFIRIWKSVISARGVAAKSAGTTKDITKLGITEYEEVEPKYSIIAGNTPSCAEIVAQMGLLIKSGTKDVKLFNGELHLTIPYVAAKESTKLMLCIIYLLEIIKNMATRQSAFSESLSLRIYTEKIAIITITDALITEGVQPVTSIRNTRNKTVIISLGIFGSFLRKIRTMLSKSIT